MAWQPEDLTSQIDGVEDTFTTTFSRVLGQLTVFYNGARLAGSFYAEINALQIQLTIVPSGGDTLFVQYLTDQTVDGRVVASGCPFPAGPATTPEGLLSILDGLDNRIDFLEQEEFFTRDPKNSVRAASTGNVVATYDPVNGLLGTGSLTGAPASIDGVLLVDDDRVLLKDQADAEENGILRVVDSGTGYWVRAPDFDEDHKVTQGARTAAVEGTVNSETYWLLINTDPVTVGGLGGDALVWRRLSSRLTIRDESSTEVVEDADVIVVPDGTLTEPTPGTAEIDFAGGAGALRNELLLGTVNGVNTVFTTPVPFRPGGEVVFFDGVRVQESCDYFRSESGGIGTGFDTITFVDPPRARTLPKANTLVSIQYVPA